MNQYIYFSSKGSVEQNHQNSDFQVNFSNPVIIPPYAEIRCVNCRINPDNNTFNVVEGENDRLAFAVGKFWIPEKGRGNFDERINQNGFPLFTVKLDEGNYALSQGTDPSYHLNAQIQDKINKQITNIPNLRNGVTVSIDSSKVITVKVSPMGGNGYYQVPDGVDLPDDLVEKMRKQNSITTTTSMKEFYPPDEQEQDIDFGELMSSPFAMRAVAPDAGMIPPNQVGEYDVSCDTLVGAFTVDMQIEIVSDTTITAKVLAVAGNLPTKLRLNTTSDLWKTDVNPCNVNIQSGANTCRIVQFTTTGPDWRGVNLYATENRLVEGIFGDCKYFMSPPITWNSLGDWAESSGKEMNLVSTFSIDLSSYDKDAESNEFRFCYSCFGDSLKGMDCGLDAGRGAGPWSGTVIPWTGDGVDEDYDAPYIGNPDPTCDVAEEDSAELDNYIYRIQFIYTGEGDNGNLEVFLKERGNLEGENPWSFMGYKNTVTDSEPVLFSVNTTNTKLCFETYVASAVENNAHRVQLVVKSNVGGAGWTTICNLTSMIVNNEPFHRLTNKRALLSDRSKPANIRFSYGHNAPLSLITTGDNFTSFDKIYFAGAYNPVGEGNGFVDGAFRSADYITSTASDLPTTLPVQIYGDDTLDKSDTNYIATQNPNFGAVVPWEWLGNARLRDSEANGGVIMGLDEEGFQFVNSNSYTTGLEFEGNCNTNARDYPQHYLDLPDLPINNVTGTATFGKPNRFIAPLDLNSGQTAKQDVHTSQNETLVYNSLGNAYEERITSLRIRICDIDSTPASNLQNYTFGCLEIRENETMRQARVMKALHDDKQALEYQQAVKPTQFNRVQ